MSNRKSLLIGPRVTKRITGAAMGFAMVVKAFEQKGLNYMVIDNFFPSKQSA